MIQLTNIPEVTTTERDALTPSTGAVVVNTTNSRLEAYSGSWAGQVPPGVRFGISVVTTGYQILVTDCVVMINAGGTAEVNLPLGTEGMEFTVKEIGGSNPVNLNATGGQNFRGNPMPGPTLTIAPINAQRVVFSNGLWCGMGIYQGGV